MRRILWMKGGALGDFIVGLPTLAALRQAWPGAEIEVVGPSSWLPLASGYAQRLEPLEGPEWASLYGDGAGDGVERGRGGLPSRLADFDLAVVLRPDPEGRLAVNLRSAGVARVLVRSPIPDGSMHVVDHNRKVLEPLGIESGSMPRVPLAHTDGAVMNGARPRARKPASHDSARIGSAAVESDEEPARDGPVIVHPGSGGVRKRWPATRFRQLAERLHARGQRPVVLLGPVELEQGEQEFWLETKLELLLSPPLEVLVGALRTACLFVGNDSGVSHLAAAVGCPALVLFGPTDPGVWAPRGPHVRVLRAEMPGTRAWTSGPGGAQRPGAAGRWEVAEGGRPLEALSVETVLDAIDDPRVVDPTTRRKE